jgi:signal transduction histidine kinase
LIVVVSVIVVLAGSAIFFLYDRTEAAKRFIAESRAERIGALVNSFDKASPADRQILLRTMSTRWIRARIFERKPELRSDMPAGIRDVTELFERHLKTLLDRPFEIGILDRAPRRRPPPARADRREWNVFNRRRGPTYRLAVVLSQPDGRWLVFHAPVRITRLEGSRRLMYVIFAAALLVLVVTVWAVHRVTRPLRQFAEAADRLGMDLRAPPLPEDGAREVRAATRAFNRMQDRLRRLIDDRTLMLAAISHDLRTVLTRLQLRAEFIDDAVQREKAVADIEEMQTMLDSTLSFARDDTVEEARTELDLSALIQSLCDDMADSGQAVKCEALPHLTYRCQPVALRRAIGNLIVNAVKYGREASVALRQDDETVTIEIADLGPGIPDTMREQVFTPFFRVEESRNRETGGTGLGLSVARSIIRRHGGDIALLDRPGGGLLARISLPVAA